jgi:hypothetical protein
MSCITTRVGGEHILERLQKACKAGAKKAAGATETKE